MSPLVKLFYLGGNKHSCIVNNCFTMCFSIRGDLWINAPAASILSSRNFLFERFLFIHLVFVPVIRSSTWGGKEGKDETIALTNNTISAAPICGAAVARSSENRGELEGRKGGEWKAVKLCPSSLPLLFYTSKCLSPPKEKPLQL